MEEYHKQLSTGTQGGHPTQPVGAPSPGHIGASPTPGPSTAQSHKRRHSGGSIRSVSAGKRQRTPATVGHQGGTISLVPGNMMTEGDTTLDGADALGDEGKGVSGGSDEDAAANNDTATDQDAGAVGEKDANNAGPLE